MSASARASTALPLRHPRSTPGRLIAAFAVSLAAHGLLLALEFGAAGDGLPWLAWKPQPRRVSLDPLRARLNPPAAPSPDPSPPPPSVRLGVPPPPALAPAPTSRRPRAVPPAAPRADRRALARTERSIDIPPLEELVVAPAPGPRPPPPRPVPPAPSFAAEHPPLLASSSAQTPVVVSDTALAAPGEATPGAPPPPPPQPESAPTTVAEVPPPAPDPPATAEREAAATAQRELAEREARRLAEAERARADDAAARERERERLEAERQANERAEAARRESERLETARREAERLEAARQEAARAEAARAEAARLAAAQAAADARRAAQDSAPPRGADLARQALDAIRAGRSAPAAVASAPRRASLLGNERVDVQLNFYGDGWRQKVERIAALNNAGLKRNRAYEPLHVTVSIRSDGSLAEVIVHNPGVERVLEEAIRRVLELAAPFAAFPPPLARQYDQVDIRRVWTYYEGRLLITVD